MNWNDLPLLLAVQRGGSLSQAARLASVDKTTISRRIAALEQALSCKLTERTGGGRLVLTETGREIAGRAEQMEDHSRAIRGLAGLEHQGAAGFVRMTAVPLIANPKRVSVKTNT